jgi:DNA-binding NarL/FixJ family response regulator
VALRVLIAEDHADIRALIGLVLRTDPAVVLVGEAEDGDAAVALARQHQPDLVLMDVMMPGVGGLEATRQIKQDLPATRVVVLTNLTDEYTLRMAFASGADSFVDKREIATRLLHAIWNATHAEKMEPPRLDPGRYDLHGGSGGEPESHSQ